MRLNEDLVEAIALAHDLGHPPFGHGGETALKEIYSPDFSHHKQSLRIVDILEQNGKGLNLTYEVRDGILKHSKGYGKIIPDDPAEMASTVEGNIVRIADIMAYLNHDLDDAIKSGVVNADQVPETCEKILGHTHSERATAMIKDLISHSKPQDGTLYLNMSDEVFNAMSELRQFLYENVYRSVRVHNEFIKARRILTELYTFFLNNETLLLKELAAMEMSKCNHRSQSKERCVCDFIASLTDRRALDLYSTIFFPSPLV
jgi:dGTPase